MKKIKLSVEEEKIEKYLENLDISKISKSRKNELKEIADKYMSKSKRITLRMSHSDLQKIKSKAVSKGIPYQTLIGSIVHQYAEDKVEVDI